MSCPKCGSELKQEDMFKYGDFGFHKKVGESIFCVNINCDFEQ